MLRLLRIVPLCGLLWTLGGCEAPLPSSPPVAPIATEGDPWAEWLVIANAEPVERDVEKAVALCSALAETEGGLTPMVEYLGDASVSAERKIVAIICLTTQRGRLGVFESRLKEWTAASQDEETRKLSTHVLGLLDTPGAMARMKELLEDGARPVRETAMGVLLSFHPELVQDRLQAFWDDPETTTLIREQVLLGMPPHLVGPFIGVYGDGATDLRLTEVARLKCVNVLGQLGTQEHLAILRKCVDNDPDVTVKEQARGALALLEASTSPAALSPGQGAAENAPPVPSGPPA